MELNSAWPEQEKELPKVDLEAFEAMIAEAYDQQTKVKQMEEAVDAEKATQKLKIMAYMDQYERTKFKSKSGTVSISEKMSVRTPKDPASKQAFFDWLKEKQIFDEYVTVNSQKLNTLYNAELEAAGDPNFTIPGIERPTAAVRTIKLLK